MIIIQIIYGDEMTSAILGEGGVLNITEILVNSSQIAYDIKYKDNTTERIYDIKRVTYQD